MEGGEFNIFFFPTAGGIKKKKKKKKKNLEIFRPKSVYWTESVHWTESYTGFSTVLAGGGKGQRHIKERRTKVGGQQLTEFVVMMRR